MVKGKATEPVVIYIENEKIELVPAGELWGRDTVKGNKQYTYADAESSKLVKERMLKKIKEHFFLGGLSAFGSNGIGMLYHHGDVPIKNWQQGLWEEEKINAINAEAFQNQFG